ncbi:MAG: hypothetical protein Q9188_006031 [Gyalolechia gomerana]
MLYLRASQVLNVAVVSNVSSINCIHATCSSLTFAQILKGASALLAQGTGAVRKEAKDDYILACTKDRADIEALVSPDLVDGGEGVEDGLRADVGAVAGVGEDLLEGRVGIVEGGVSCVGNDEGFEDVKVGGVGEEGSDNVYWS